MFQSVSGFAAAALLLLGTSDRIAQDTGQQHHHREAPVATAKWDLQVSTGHLKDPEALEPGNIQRTTASAGWMNQRGDDFDALTVGYGVCRTNEDDGRASTHTGT